MIFQQNIEYSYMKVKDGHADEGFNENIVGGCLKPIGTNCEFSINM